MHSVTNMATIRAVIFTLLALTSPVVRSARILMFFPTPAISHQVLFRPITHALAARGHEVLVVTPDPAFPKGEAPANLTEIDVHDVSYQNWTDIFIYHRGVKEDLMNEVQLMFKTYAYIFDAQMTTPEVQEKIMSKDKDYFDMVILEGCNRPLMGMIHRFSAPVIYISSWGAVESHYMAFGAPIHPLLYPTPGRQRLYNLSLYEKAMEIFKLLMLDHLVTSTKELDTAMVAKHFGDGVPDFDTLALRVSMIFINEHPLWADNRPVPPSVLYIGGIHQPTENELPKVNKYNSFFLIIF